MDFVLGEDQNALSEDGGSPPSPASRNGDDVRVLEVHDRNPMKEGLRSLS